MSLKFTGNASPSNANVTIYGDGTSTAVDIDLAKAPFNVDFKGLAPSSAFLDTSNTSGVSLSLNRDKLTVTFATAPSATDFNSPGSGQPSPRAELSIEFIYG
jgi:hypothetical protein